MKKHFISLLAAIILPTLTQAAETPPALPTIHVEWPAHIYRYSLSLNSTGGFFCKNGKNYALTENEVAILRNMLKSKSISYKTKNKELLSTAKTFAQTKKCMQ